MTSVTQEIPVGYKQTDVGCIPNDWVVKQISDCCSYHNGTALERYFNNRDGYVVISIGNYSPSGTFVETGNYISKDYSKELNAYLLQKSDLAMLLNDKTANGTIIGRALLIESDNTYIFNQRTMRLRCKEGVHPAFLYFQINHDTTHQRIVGMAKPGTQIYLNTNDITQLKIPLPPTETEQRAIAAVLSDANALINRIHRLIAKKRDLKRAAMQQLLTGKTRLPGFSGDWTEAILGNLLTMKATYGIVKAGGFKESGVPMLRGGDIKGGRIGVDLPFVSYEKSVEYSRTILKRDDVVIALVGYPGEAAMVPAHLEGANISRAVGLLRLNNKITPDFLVSYLNSPIGRRMVLAPSAGSAQLVVNLASLNKLRFPLPPISEQASLAAVLSDMDSELAALEQRRDKARDLKQGMMQELLTGKTRLI